jgi:hypothetical protein
LAVWFVSSKFGVSEKMATNINGGNKNAFVVRHHTMIKKEWTLFNGTHNKQFGNIPFVWFPK